MAWRHAHTYTSGATITLPSHLEVKTGDVVRISVVHGEQQTIDYIGGVDFTFTAPSTITVSGLELTSGDVVHIFNLSKTKPVNIRS